MAIEIKPKSKPNHIELASLFLNRLCQFRIFHTQSLSLSHHLAFSETYQLYDSIYDIFIETIQGKEEVILKGFKSYSLVDLSDPISLIKEDINKINNYRKSLTSDYDEIDNMLQETVASLEKTIYKLKFLK
jgi:hypothetical protein